MIKRGCVNFLYFSPTKEIISMKSIKKIINQMKNWKIATFYYTKKALYALKLQVLLELFVF